MSRLHSSVFLALVLGGAAMIYFVHSSAHVPTTAPVQIVTSAETEKPTERIAPQGQKEFQSATYHFTLFYPENLTEGEHIEGLGAMTYTFQNEKTAEGFQIYVTPYDQPQVDAARFKQDEPSGVRESLTAATIDGATGAAFYSMNSDLGATREIWFIHGGFLYEVTTLKSLDVWLTDILRTWKFIT